MVVVWKVSTIRATKLTKVGRIDRYSVMQSVWHTSCLLSGAGKENLSIEMVAELKEVLQGAWKSRQKKW